MRLSQIISSTRIVAREQGVSRMLRLSVERSRELSRVRAALRGDLASRTACLESLINDRLEFDFITLEPRWIEACDPTILRCFCYRRFREIAALLPQRVENLDELALTLLCDVLYRTWDYRALADIAALLRARVNSPPLRRRVDNMIRRAQISSGQLTAGARDLAPAPQGSFADNLLRGDVWNASGRMDLATDAYRRAIEMHSDNPMARLHYGFHLLKKGAIAEGLICWGLAERIFGHFPLRFSHPLWRGEPLAGKTLLIVFEHGFGDMIQFARYLLPLQARHPGAKIVGRVPAPIISLFTRSFPGVLFLADEAEINPDFHIAVTQLPITLGGAMYEPRRYIAATRRASARGSTGPLRVGVCWRGHPRQYEQSRSIAVDMFSRLFAVEGVEFTVLLNTVTPGERAHLKRFANVSIPTIPDFLTLADEVAACDLVVTVDTSIVHLAGALGTRTLLLSRPDACWRWGATGHTSPWYDNVTIIRHPHDLDWPHVLDAACSQIEAAQTRTSPLPVPAVA